MPLCRKIRLRSIYARRCRRIRSINTNCLIMTYGALIFATVIIIISIVLYQIMIYQHFMRTYPFSNVPFWKDNRTLQSTPLSTVISVDQVNLSNATIVIAASCRNVEKALVQFRRNVLSIGQLFRDFRIYLCESDSTDRTLQMLNDWRNNDTEHVRLYSYGQKSFFSYRRTHRIAQCRNRLLDEARSEWPSFDYYFVVDVDVGSSPLFDVNDFRSNFIYPSSAWIAMTATQRAEYYDIWALRVRDILPFDCWQMVSHVASFYLDQEDIVERLIQIHQLPIPKNRSLIEVDSAFGGAALYPRQYLHEKCSYDGEYSSSWFSPQRLWNDQQCEHVKFHQCLKKFAPEQKIFINPTFQIC